jgi:hypothetical protein
MLVAALAFVGTYGSNVPFQDDWELVLVRTGDQPVTGAWLWEPLKGGYRSPLPKLLLVALSGVTGSDFRADMYFAVLTLGAVAFAMIRAARRVRGCTSYTDAFFPLALLNLGHQAQFSWSILALHVLTTLLLAMLFVMIVQNGRQFTLWCAVLAGGCLVCLPLGGWGFPVYVPALALWLGYVGILRWPVPPHGKRDALVMLAFAGAALVLLAFYFKDYHGPTDLYSPSFRTSGLTEPGEVLETTLKFMTMSLGQAAAAFWPVSGLVGGGLFFLGAATLVWAVWANPRAERSRALGLLAFLASFSLLALAVGWKRPGKGFSAYYSIAAVPGLCCLYFTWTVYGQPARRRLAQMVLFTVVGCMVSLNTFSGLQQAEVRRRPLAAFEQDMAAGVPASVLIKRYAPFLCPAPDGQSHAYHGILTKCLPALRDAGIGPFRCLCPDPGFEEMSLPVVPGKTDAMARQMDTGGWAGARKEARLVFNLPKPRFISGVRVKYLLRDSAATQPVFWVFWGKKGGTTDAPNIITNGPSNPTGPPVAGPSSSGEPGATNPGRVNRYVHLEHRPGSEEQSITIWVCDTVDHLVIYQDNASFTVHISGVVLLLPVTAAQRPTIP